MHLSMYFLKRCVAQTFMVRSSVYSVLTSFVPPALGTKCIRAAKRQFHWT
jgi:hypothetical protein